MRNLEILDYKTPMMVDWFQKFINCDLHALEAEHPLRLYTDAYDAWTVDKFGSALDNRPKLPKEVIEFATFIYGIQLSQRDLQGEVKSNFVSDLINGNSCYGVLFELKVLISCYILEYENLHYRCNKVDGKCPDIMFTIEGPRRVYIECTRKLAKPQRVTDDKLLIGDFKNSLREKAEDYKLLSVPLIYAVHVPEKIDLTRSQFRTDLGKEIQTMFKDNIFKNVNWVIFSSYRPPFKDAIDARGNIIYNTDLIHLRYPNPNIDPNLKVLINFGHI
jgi:hypothetical protein